MGLILLKTVYFYTNTLFIHWMSKIFTNFFYGCISTILNAFGHFNVLFIQIINILFFEKKRKKNVCSSIHWIFFKFIEKVLLLLESSQGRHYHDQLWPSNLDTNRLFCKIRWIQTSVWNWVNSHIFERDWHLFYSQYSTSPCLIVTPSIEKGCKNPYHLKAVFRSKSYLDGSWFWVCLSTFFSHFQNLICNTFQRDLNDISDLVEGTLTRLSMI